MYDCRTGSFAWSSLSRSISRWCDRGVTLRVVTWNLTQFLLALSVVNARSAQSNATQWAVLIHKKPCRLYFGMFPSSNEQPVLRLPVIQSLMSCVLFSWKSKFELYPLILEIRVPDKRHVLESSIGTLVSIVHDNQRFGKRFFVEESWGISVTVCPVLNWVETSPF